MKGLIYSLFFGACLSSVLGVILHNPPAGRCPKNNSYYDSYAHVDCHKFYICDWGYGIERECAMASATEWLVFNPKLQVCDWKNAAIKDGAVCSGSTGPTDPIEPTIPIEPTNPTGPIVTPGVCPLYNEYYHSYAHANCNKFYKCDWGKGVEFDCPWANTAKTERLVFNPKLQVCDWKNAAVKDGAVCSGSTGPTDPIEPTIPIEPTNPTGPIVTPGVCPLYNEYYHSYAHANCNKFYKCDWGKGVEFDCPWANTAKTERLVFNPKLQVCDWKNAAVKDGAVCSGSTGPTDPIEPTIPIEPTNPTIPIEPTNPTGPIVTPGVCPLNNEYYHSYAHANCNKFYKCDWGKGVEFDCPWANTAKTERLVFNPKLQVCDWKNAAIKDGAVCSGSTGPTDPIEPTIPIEPTNPTGPIVTPGVCPLYNEYYHSYAHANCNKFYKCDWGKGVEFDCPWANTAKTERLVFNPKLQVCDWKNAAVKDGAVCSGSTGPTDPIEPTIPIEPTNPTIPIEPTNPTGPIVTPGVCPLNNEYYHSYAHANCNKFYKCDWGKGVEFDCPWANTAKTERLVFNPKLQVCDWKNAAIKDGAVCSGSTGPTDPIEPTIPIEPTNPTGPIVTPGVCPLYNEYYHSYAHANCNKFYKCDWGKGVEFDCPWANTAKTERLVFNPKLQVCDWKNAAVKDGAVCSGSTGPTDPIEPTIPIEPTNPTIPIEPTNPTGPIVTPGVCPLNNEYYHSYAHANCNKFYKCDWGKGVEFDCPWANTAKTERLVFNPKLQVCDWKNAAIKDGAVCSGSTGPTDPIEPTIPIEPTNPTGPIVTPGVCPLYNEYYHSYAHANCNKFYKCDWGKGVEFDCPWANTAKTERLVFNPKLQVCDWKNAAVKDGAVCSGSTGPTDPIEPTIPIEPTNPTIPIEPTNPTGPIVTPGVCPLNNEYYHSYAHANCNKFYKCDWGKGVEFDCPWANTAKTERLVFNPKLQVCDWKNAAIKDGAVCSGSTGPGSTGPTDPIEPTIPIEPTNPTGPIVTPGVCPLYNEYYHSYAHANCNKFYKCDWGKGVEFDCPWANTAKTERLVFNPKLQICDWKNAAVKDGAVCSGSTGPTDPIEPTIPIEPTNPTGPIVTPGVCPLYNEYYHSYAHANCNKFYKCDWGKGVEFDCPWANTAKTERLVFNPKLQVCDWKNAAIKDGAVCSGSTGPTDPIEPTIPIEPTNPTIPIEPTNPTGPIVTPGVCPLNNEYYHSYAHANCNKFYKCDWGKGVEFDCPWANTAKTERLVFNPKLQVCDWKKAAIKDGAVCSGSTGPTDPIEPTIPIEPTNPTGPIVTPGVCPLNNEYYHSYAHANCNKFYKCDWGKGVEFDCPWANTAKTERLVFNPKLQICDWKAAAIKSGAKC